LPAVAVEAVPAVAVEADASKSHRHKPIASLPPPPPIVSAVSAPVATATAAPATAEDEAQPRKKKRREGGAGESSGGSGPLKYLPLVAVLGMAVVLVPGIVAKLKAKAGGSEEGENAPKSGLVDRIVNLIRCYVPGMGYTTPGTEPDAAAMERGCCGCCGCCRSLSSLAPATASPSSDNKKIKEWAVKGGGGLPPMANASLSFAVAFDDEDDASQVDGSSRGVDQSSKHSTHDPCWCPPLPPYLLPSLLSGARRAQQHACALPLAPSDACALPLAPFRCMRSPSCPLPMHSLSLLPPFSRYSHGR
jgi:hypothetical protein